MLYLDHLYVYRCDDSEVLHFGRIPHHCCSLCRAPAFFDFPGDWERSLRPPCEESSLAGGFQCIQNIGMEIEGP